MVPVDEIITPRTLVTVHNEGMPVFVGRKEELMAEDNQKYKGYLFVKFDISFPKTLSEDQR